MTTPAVADTHVLLWWTLDPEKLSPAVHRACAEAEERGSGLLVSSVSLWELGVKIKRGKLNLGMPIEDFASRLERLTYVEVVSVSAALWLRNLRLAWDHRDPADRTIVALAEERGFPLLTKDAVIHAFYSRAVW